jgi:hypothetical protein
VRELESRYLDKVVMIARFRESKVVELPGALTIIIVVSSGTNYLKPFCCFSPNINLSVFACSNDPLPPRHGPLIIPRISRFGENPLELTYRRDELKELASTSYTPNRAAAGGVGNHHLVCEQVTVRSDAFMMQTSIQ